MSNFFHKFVLRSLGPILYLKWAENMLLSKFVQCIYMTKLNDVCHVILDYLLPRSPLSYLLGRTSYLVSYELHK